MDQPPDLIDSTHPEFVCLFHKSLYGLKHAPRVWFAKLSTTLIDIDFQASCYDSSLFLSHQQGHILIFFVYVDDIIVTDNNPCQIDQCIAQLHHYFFQSRLR
jgi:Reverse transcriptase (RNA-dependent DNA polymerase)